MAHDATTSPLHILDRLRGDLPDEQIPRDVRALRREVHAYGKRRCDVERSRDNLVYQIGAAFEAVGALELDSVALTGILSMPTDTLFAVLPSDEFPPNVISVIRAAMQNTKVFAWARAQGEWLQLSRLRHIYQEEVANFERSYAYSRPGWRSKRISAPQRYLIGEICRLKGLSDPGLTNRGAAYEFIREHGGNPRFWDAPVLPPKLEV